MLVDQIHFLDCCAAQRAEVDRLPCSAEEGACPRLLSFFAAAVLFTAMPLVILVVL
jgi:hypothetical protein